MSEIVRTDPVLAWVSGEGSADPVDVARLRRAVGGIRMVRLRDSRDHFTPHLYEVELLMEVNLRDQDAAAIVVAPFVLVHRLLDVIERLQGEQP